MRAITSVVIAICMSFAAVAAQAATMKVSAIGTVVAVFVPDAYGTTPGDVITLQGTFDSGSLVDESAVFGTPGLQFGSLDSLGVNMHGQHWTQADDPLFGLPIFGAAIPHIVLVDGQFYGLDFFGIGEQHNAILLDALDQLFGNLPPGIILGGNDDPNAAPFWIGFWNPGATVTAVPEPGAWIVLLYGVAGLGAAMRARRRLASRAEVRRTAAAP